MSESDKHILPVYTNIFLDICLFFINQGIFQGRFDKVYRLSMYFSMYFSVNLCQNQQFANARE